MKYLFILLAVSTLSCNKDSIQGTKYDPPPAVTKVETSSEVINGTAHPKISITLSVPDPAATKQFLLFFETSNIPMALLSPKSGTYTFVDAYNSYPPAADKKTYTSAFVMADNSTIYNSTFDVN